MSAAEADALVAAAPFVPPRSERVTYVRGFSGETEQTGDAAVNAAIAHAEEQGYARLMLRPSAAGAAFYRAAGFVPAGDDMVVLETGGG